jgi:hypothetical protein
VKKLHERLIIAGLATLLVGYFVYQVAYGTNESSYKWGYRQGKLEYSNCTSIDNGCGTADTSCFSPIHIATGVGTTHYRDTPHYEIMTNKTACMNGYIHAWNHICDPIKSKNRGLNCPITGYRPEDQGSFY